MSRTILILVYHCFELLTWKMSESGSDNVDEVYKVFNMFDEERDGV